MLDAAAHFDEHGWVLVPDLVPAAVDVAPWRDEWAARRAASPTR